MVLIRLGPVLEPPALIDSKCSGQEHRYASRVGEASPCGVLEHWDSASNYDTDSSDDDLDADYDLDFAPVSDSGSRSLSLYAPRVSLAACNADQGG